ncbi:MAG: dipeptide epimerase [Rhodobacteraceae bacterium]|nr:dipeptide epimerase [Paracoccaceae bacterium]
MPLSVGIEKWPLATPFAIARGVKTEAVTVVVRVSDGKNVGLGECTPYARYGETPEQVREALWNLNPMFGREEMTAESPAALRSKIAAVLPAGAARNAVDCALWDLEAKQTGRSAAELTGLNPPPEIITAVTLGIDSPKAMAAAAKTAAAPLLKVKLGAGQVADETARLHAIRAAAPESKLIIDANEGWSAESLTALDPVCVEVGALFIEQPLPSDQDAALSDLSLQTPLCADESCHTVEDLPRLKGRYQVVNVKLDKTGGLSGAIALRTAALSEGFDVMVGCMLAGSLAMAPAYLLTESALAVDLDGPLWLKQDREPPMKFVGARMFPPSSGLWG